MSNQHLLKREYTFIFVRQAESWESTHPNFVAWREAQMAIIELAKKCEKYDESGIDIYFATHPPQKKLGGKVNDLAKVFQLKNPPSADDLVSSLKAALDHHFDHENPDRKETILVIIDHLPNGQEQVIDLLIESSHRLGTESESLMGYRLGISFVLIGENEEAKQFLTFLDDQLESQGSLHDIVDTKSWMAMKQNPIEHLLLDALKD